MAVEREEKTGGQEVGEVADPPAGLSELTSRPPARWATGVPTPTARMLMSVAPSRCRTGRFPVPAAVLRG